jgi:DNA-directed RNA polymerase subunit F
MYLPHPLQRHHWQKVHRSFSLSLAIIAIFVASSVPGNARQTANPDLEPNQQKLVRHGNMYARLGKAEKASDAYQQALSSATSVGQCLAIASASEHYGHILLEARRSCLNKAETLSKTRDEFFQVALRARNYELYEITKAAIDSLIARAQSNDDLYDLARKAQTISLNDVAHLALQKAYTQTTSVSEALNYAKQAKLLGMEDLCRKAIRDLIDDESDAHALCNLLAQIDPLQEMDLNRTLLKKAVDCVKDVDQCKEVFDTARRYDQRDIVALASYRGRRMILLQQYKEDQARYEQQLEEWRSGRVDAQEQQAANDAMNQRKSNGVNEPGF